MKTISQQLLPKVMASSDYMEAHYMGAALAYFAEQRTLEIARKGFSQITLPKQRKTNKKQTSTLFCRDGEDKDYAAAVLLIAKTLKDAQTRRHALEVKIHHDSRMAEERLVRRNEKGACLSMKKVMTAQFEYIHILQRIAAIAALQYSLENGLIKASLVEDILIEVTSTTEPGDTPTEFNNDEALDQLECGDFFPILDTETGTITFTNSYNYASNLEVVDSRPEQQQSHQSPKSVSGFI
ncbi:unnamed protein product [Cylindrotheca closterium]|uniref:Uncharacterized protein n=1 Tax=Cylindrotheca closterium TaxID=2856 RepID=A0AAD2G1R6_9STRA|nr:unnamed protein product [Cylindrotheca closterium]